MDVGALGGVSGGSGVSAQEQQLVEKAGEGLFTMIFNQLQQTSGQLQEAASQDDPDDPNSEG